MTMPVTYGLKGTVRTIAAAASPAIMKNIEGGMRNAPCDICGIRMLSRFLGNFFAEKSLRSHHQKCEEDDKSERILVGHRDIRSAEAFNDAKADAADHRPADIAEATDNGRRKRLEGNGGTHRDREIHDRP